MLTLWTSVSWVKDTSPPADVMSWIYQECERTYSRDTRLGYRETVHHMEHLWHRPRRSHVLRDRTTRWDFGHRTVLSASVSAMDMGRSLTLMSRLCRLTAAAEVRGTTRENRRAVEYIVGDQKVDEKELLMNDLERDVWNFVMEYEKRRLQQVWRPLIPSYLAIP